jgi:predicted transcriptional regulator of viral defense system
MMVDEWLDFFKRNTSKKIFSLSDLILLTGERSSTISVQLSRLVSSGIVDRPVRGWYTNPFRPPDDEELAMVIRIPSYISMEYALSRYGILSQNVFTYTLVTTRLPYTFRSKEKVFEYHQVKRSLFWGYVNEGTVLIAEPEKALLDLIYIRFARGRKMDRDMIDSLIDDIYLEDLDKDKLLAYSDKFDTVTRALISDILVAH